MSLTGMRLSDLYLSTQVILFSSASYKSWDVTVATTSRRLQRAMYCAPYSRSIFISKESQGHSPPISIPHIYHSRAPHIATTIATSITT